MRRLYDPDIATLLAPAQQLHYSNYEKHRPKAGLQDMGKRFVNLDFVAAKDWPAALN